MDNTIKRTLIIRFSSVGDIVLSSLLLRVFRKSHPATQVDFLVRSEYADLVRHNPHISRVLEFPDHGSLSDLTQFRRRIRTSGYDLVIDIHDSLRSRYLCAGMPGVVRINKRKLARFLLVKLKYNAYERLGGAPSVAIRYLEPVQQYSVKDDGQGLEVFVPPPAEERARAVLEEGGIPPGQPVVGVCPTARHFTKTWPADRFAEAGAELAGMNDAAVVLFGAGGAEQVRCAEVARALADRCPGRPVVNLAGRLTLLETAAALSRCALVISNDSGLMHLSAARRRNVVAVFGSTVRQLGFFPFRTDAAVVENEDLGCRPCTHIGLPACPRGHFRCMTDISAARVVHAARQLMGN